MTEPEERMLLEVLNDGEELLLDDGSQWFINPGDIPTVCIWIPTTIIKVEIVDPDDFCPYGLTNVTEDIMVRARRTN